MAAGTLGRPILADARVKWYSPPEYYAKSRWRGTLAGSEADANPSSSSRVVSDARGHQAVLEDFLEAIRTNTEPRCNGEEGRRSVAVVQAIYEACRTEKRVYTATENN